MARPRAAMPPAAAILALVDADGRLAIRVTPGAAADAIALPEPGGVLTIRITAPPADGAANEAVLRLLAKALDRAPSSLELLRGASSRHKLIRLLA